MLRKFSGVLAATLLASFALLLAALPAGATVNGGCTATASDGTNLTTASDWTLHLNDEVSGTGSAPSELQGVGVTVIFFGVKLPANIYASDSKGKGGSSPTYKVADYAKYGRVLVVAGSAGGGAGAGGCDGSVLITIVDENAFTNAISLVGLVLGGLGILVLLGLAFAAASCFSRVLGFIFGLLAGVGIGLVLMEMGVLDPRALAGLAVPAVGAIVGAVLPGVLHHGPTAAVSPPPSA